ncbi:DUF1990 family protein [Kribbella sp. VKM Ac-2566]|uniref:DUF1990 family protein n=1 Tax=Kribbella sp. VKM Ac-2566 TaxID=2512218 RepID=UPI0010F391CA|nr:DUF1990 domain-containing protein [Kribbella sp. VKM Ac-2566]TDW92599.1 uncharacterized protein (UPF0548 family) [Kribbella sp. VKM Ac-2566]
MTTGLTYAAVGATCVADPVWTVVPRGYRCVERTTRIGQGLECWDVATAAMGQWTIKTRSGFSVQPAVDVREEQDYTLLAALGPYTLREPVRVVAVVARPDRHGFAYGTRHGHPVSGEEAFVVHRSPEGVVWLTIRSMTRPGRGLWRLAFPAVLVAQRWYRRRYQRAMVR